MIQMEGESKQGAVYRAVISRGYRKEWTSQQFAVRQVAKLTEELAELARTTRPGAGTKPMWWKSTLDQAGYDAAWAFDNYDWDRAGVGDLEQTKAELADIQVVVFCLASALGEIDGEPFDVVEAALEKATRDISRGVR